MKIVFGYREAIRFVSSNPYQPSYERHPYDIAVTWSFPKKSYSWENWKVTLRKQMIIINHRTKLFWGWNLLKLNLHRRTQHKTIPAGLISFVAHVSKHSNPSSNYVSEIPESTKWLVKRDKIMKKEKKNITSLQVFVKLIFMQRPWQLILTPVDQCGLYSCGDEAKIRYQFYCRA